MIIKEYNYLPEEARIIRTEVFVKEQKFVQEFDEIDNISKLIVIILIDIAFIYMV